jgi:Tfp pilus assembly protein PilV
MRSRRASREQERRSAFTIAEVLVALVLFAVALLGLAANSAIAVRATGGALRERRAVQRAADRIAALRAQGCSAARSGGATDAALALTERWTATASGAVVLVDEEVRWRAAAGPRVLLLRSAMLC